MEELIKAIFLFLISLGSLLGFMGFALWLKREEVFPKETPKPVVDHLPSCIVREEGGEWYFDCDPGCPIDIRYRAKQAQFGRP